MTDLPNIPRAANAADRTAAAPDAVRVIEDPVAAAAILDPMRLRILENLQRPDSASGLARRLGLPRQKINYHVRELERFGFVRAISQRRKGNCVERLVLAAARSFLIGPRALGSLAIGTRQMAESQTNPAADSLAALAQAVSRIAPMSPATGGSDPHITARTLHFARPEHRAAFQSELDAAIARLAARYCVNSQDARDSGALEAGEQHCCIAGIYAAAPADEADPAR